jgi:integration host factor subunit beta
MIGLRAGVAEEPPRIIGDSHMTKSELIEILAAKNSHLNHKDVELAVKSLIEQMSQSLSTGHRIEIRGFGSFSLHYRPPRMGRNPKTGEAVALAAKYVPHFKPGKELRERVNIYASGGTEAGESVGREEQDAESAGGGSLF